MHPVDLYTREFSLRGAHAVARSLGLVTLSLALLCATACDSSTEIEITDDPTLSGGETTIFDTTRNAFGFSARNMASDRRSQFFVGNSFFNRNWVTAPASTDGRDGLGPTFNARACASCHFKDGRGAAPTGPDEEPLALLFRLSVPGEGAHGSSLPDPNYGGQFNPRAVLDVPAEGRVVVSYVEEPGTYPDGTEYSLRRPVHRFEDLAFGPMADDVMVSPRVAPVTIGLGLLEHIPEADLLAKADPDDADGDGISGRPNYPWNIREQKHTLGRFGWKASEPTVEQQVAGAFRGDIGITSELFPDEDCPEAQVDCQNAPTGGEPELASLTLERVTFYQKTLAVPGRRNYDDPDVQAGDSLFDTLGCAACHIRRWETGHHEDWPELSNQVIFPLTDLLIHDMGEALSDNRPDFDATGREWRTPPLWGIGLVETVNRHTTFLHDGRARNLEEAILWHGGEAERSRDAFKALPKVARDQVIAFLNSL